MTGRRTVKYQRHTTAATQGTQPKPRLPTILEEISAVQTPQVSPHNNTVPNNNPRAPSSVNRETILKQIKEIKAGLAEIQKISKQIDRKINHEARSNIA